MYLIHYFLNKILKIQLADIGRYRQIDIGKSFKILCFSVGYNVRREELPSWLGTWKTLCVLCLVLLKPFCPIVVISFEAKFLIISSHIKPQKKFLKCSSIYYSELGISERSYPKFGSDLFWGVSPFFQLENMYHKFCLQKERGEDDAERSGKDTAQMGVIQMPKSK